jgi:hypothetical protein
MPCETGESQEKKQLDIFPHLAQRTQGIGLTLRVMRRAPVAGVVVHALEVIVVKHAIVDEAVVVEGIGSYDVLE